jgi:peptidoglycan hydrolase-like amidase
MCQLGAKFMGEKGYTSAAILKHYYPDALLQKLW